MDAAKLEKIEDIETLRHVALEEFSHYQEAQALLKAEVAQHVSKLLDKERTLEKLGASIIYKDLKIESLTAEIMRLRRWQYAAKSEQFDPTQEVLFEESMSEDIEAVEVELEQVRSEPTPSARSRGRQSLPAHLPRVDERHDLESCACTQCGGALIVIGEDVSEKLDCEPIQFFVRRSIRSKYACRHCETIEAAPAPASIIERSLAAPGLLAQVLVSKYADHQPLYRQSEIYARSGVELSRSTLAQWVGAVGVHLQPLVNELRDLQLRELVLHADETPVAMLAPGEGKTRRAYLFAYRSTGAHPSIVFDFCENRSGKHAQRFLDGYQGALVVDDYSGYKALFAQGKITELACWAHARRKFYDLHVAGKSQIAEQTLKHIQELYAIEAHCRVLDIDTRKAYRQQHAKPKTDDIYRWLTTIRPKVSAGSGTAKAIDYTLKRWNALVRYLDDGCYPIDNNPVENAIRPIALGRKNWLFAGSPTAGRRAAAIMSLIATAKAAGHDPHAYLKDILARLPTHPNRRIQELLPQNWMPSST